jgi:hypothetical protein
VFFNWRFDAIARCIELTGWNKNNKDRESDAWTALTIIAAKPSFASKSQS